MHPLYLHSKDAEIDQLTEELIDDSVANELPKHDSKHKGSLFLAGRFTG